MVETSAVNEELQKNFSELFMQHFTRPRETCTGKKVSNKQEFYKWHIRAAINLPDLALELGRQSTRSSPERLFAKSFQPPF